MDKRFWTHTPALLTVLTAAFDRVSQMGLSYERPEPSAPFQCILHITINRSTVRLLPDPIPDPTLAIPLNGPMDPHTLDILHKIHPSLVSLVIPFFQKNAPLLLDPQTHPLIITGLLRDLRMPTFEPKADQLEPCIQMLLDGTPNTPLLEQLHTLIYNHQQLYADLPKPYLDLVDRLHSAFEHHLLDQTLDDPIVLLSIAPNATDSTDLPKVKTPKRML